MNFSFDEISTLLKENFINCDYRIKAVGNHELNRHYVFLVIDEKDNEYILKFYYKKISFEREHASLKLLESSDAKTAKILAKGHRDSELFWLLIDKFPGELFESMRFGMNREELNDAYYSMGEEMARIHDAYSFDFFGSWDMDGKSYDSLETYKESFIKSRDFDIVAIVESDLPHKEELIDAIEYMQDHYYRLDNLNGSVICHRDFDGRNVLVDKINGKYQVTATLDFEHSIPFHYTWDFVNMYHKYFTNDSEGMTSFYAGYKSIRHIDLIPDDLLNFYMLCIGIQICSWAFNRSLTYYDKGLKLIRTYR